MQEKAGFVPNVFLTLAHRPDEFRAFFAYHDALMLKEGGLTKAEREMIVVATSGANDCLYCIVAHGAILRIYAKDPLVADQVAVNYRKADITPRQKAMLEFALKVALQSVEHRRRGLRGAARARILRRGHLGHRRHRGVLRAVEPDGEHDRHAPERRVPPARPDAAETPGVAVRGDDVGSSNKPAACDDEREQSACSTLGVTSCVSVSITMSGLRRLIRAHRRP